MIKSDLMDHTLIEEILDEPGGEHFLDCWSCGTCAATCLVRRYEPGFNPRVMLHKAGLGLRDVVLSSGEIWQCSACDACFPRCPKEIHISDVMKAIRNVAIRHGFTSPNPHAEVDEAICSGCAVCTRACPYDAIERTVKMIDGVERGVAQVDPNLCQHCGVCVAACPSGSMNLEVFNDIELLTRMGAEGWLDEPGFLAGATDQPRLLAFVCQWSLRSDSELERVQDMFGERVRVVNLPCSGRVDPSMILLALTKGADGVLVVGCDEGECHYQRGTYLGRSKVALLDQIMEQLGVSASRVRFEQLNALDRFVLPSLIERMSADIVASVAVKA